MDSASRPVAPLLPGYSASPGSRRAKRKKQRAYLEGLRAQQRAAERLKVDSREGFVTQAQGAFQLPQIERVDSGDVFYDRRQQQPNLVSRSVDQPGRLREGQEVYAMRTGARGSNNNSEEAERARLEEVVARENQRVADVLNRKHEQVVTELVQKIDDEQRERIKISKKLDYVALMAERRETSLTERLTRQEKVRVKQDRTQSELRDRLRQLETELLDAREWRRRQDELRDGNKPEGAEAGAEVARLLAELRARDERDRLMAEEDVKKKTELWEEVLRVKRSNDELRRQVSQFAALSGDKVQSIQDRMRSKESTVAILEERTSKGIETQAEERSALQSQVTALSVGMEEMQQQLRMERRLRERAEEETRQKSTQLKSLLDSQKEILLNKIEETRDATWTERGAERESESRMQKFRDEKAEHHVDSTKARFENLEKALREERADRIRFEKAMKDDVHADIQRIEAGEGREKAAAGITMQKFLQGVRVRLKKMRIEIEDIRDEAGSKTAQRDLKLKQSLLAVSKSIDKLRDDAKVAHDSLENVLRAEVKARLRMERDVDAKIESRIQEERADLLQRTTKLRVKVETVESSVEKAKHEMEEKLTSEVARLEADAKTSLEIQSRALAGLDAALQALSVRVDGYASERRQSSAVVRMEIQALRKDAATNERVTLLEEILRDETTAVRENLEESMEAQKVELVHAVMKERKAREKGDISVGSELTTIIGETEMKIRESLRAEEKERKDAVNDERDKRVAALSKVTKTVAADMVAIRGKMNTDIGNARQAASETLRDAMQTERAARIDNDLLTKQVLTVAREKLRTSLTQKMENMETGLSKRVAVVEDAFSASAMRVDLEKLEAGVAEDLAAANGARAQMMKMLSAKIAKEKEERVKGDAEALEEFCSKLGSMEVVLRRGFEEECASLAALHKANVQAEAAARLAGSNRTKKEFSARLRTMQDWLLEYTKEKIAYLNDRFTGLLEDESQIRVRSTFETRRMEKLRWEQHLRLVKSKEAISAMLDEIADRHAGQERLQNSIDLANGIKLLQHNLDVAENKLYKHVKQTRLELQTNIDAEEGARTNADEAETNARIIADDNEQRARIASDDQITRLLRETDSKLRALIRKESKHRVISDNILNSGLTDEHVENTVARVLSSITDYIADHDSNEKQEADALALQRSIWMVQEETADFIQQESIARTQADFEILQEQNAESEIRRALDMIVEAAIEVNEEEIRVDTNRKNAQSFEAARVDRRLIEADSRSARRVLRQDMNAAFYKSNTSMKRLRQETKDRFESSDVQRKLDLMGAAIAEATIQAKLDENTEAARIDREIMRDDIDARFLKSNTSMRGLREETKTRFEAVDVERKLDVAAAVVVERALQEKIDHNTEVARLDRNKVRAEGEEARFARKEIVDAQFAKTNKSLKQLRVETFDALSANDVQRKLDLMASAATEATIQQKIDQNTNFAEYDRAKMRGEMGQGFLHAMEARTELEDDTNSKIISTRKDLLKLRKETWDTFTANDVQRKVDLMAAVVAEGAFRDDVNDSFSELRDESQHARAKLNASMNESFEHAANDRDVMRREIDDSFKSTHKSLKRLREETNERFQSNAVARTVDLVAALASEKEILERMDNSLNEAYAFEEGKRQEQYAYEEAARNQQYEYDESKRQELRAEVDSALEAAERDRAKIKKTAASNSTAAALARKENQAQVKSRFRSNAVERVLDALCTSVELLETNEVRDAENAHVKRQALALEKRVQTKILDESKQQSDMRFALQEEVDKKLELAEAEREHNRSHLESMIEEEKAATAASLKKQENQIAKQRDDLQSDLASSLTVETIVNAVVEGELNARLGMAVDETNEGFEKETKNRVKVDKAIDDRRMEDNAAIHEQLGGVVDYVQKMQKFERKLASQGDAKLKVDFDASQLVQDKKLEEHAAKHKNLAVKQSDQDSKITMGEEKQDKTDAEQIEQNETLEMHGEKIKQIEILQEANKKMQEQINQLFATVKKLSEGMGSAAAAAAVAAEAPAEEAPAAAAEAKEEEEEEYSGPTYWTEEEDEEQMMTYFLKRRKDNGQPLMKKGANGEKKQITSDTKPENFDAEASAKEHEEALQRGQDSVAA